MRDRTDPYKGTNFAAYPGDIVFSKIDARSGAIGVLPPEISKAVVTAEFPVFTADPARLDGEFVKLVLRTGGFIEALRRKASGTTGRKRITPDAFQDLRIPLPPLEEQRAIVAAYRTARDHAASLEKEADETEAMATEGFEAALGLQSPPHVPDRPIFVSNFKNFERWSHDGVLRSVLHIEDSEQKFAIVPLSRVGRVSYGLQKSPANRPSSHPRPYLRVANVQRWHLDLDVIKTINVPDEDMSRYQLEDGDVLLCEGNSPDLVGRGAIWHNEIAECIHQNHVLRVRLDQSQALPEFVLSVINSRYGQAYFRSKAKRTTNLASINSKEVAGFRLPLPTRTEQRAMIDALIFGQNAARKKREKALEVRAQAWTDFETAVYAAETN